MIRRHKKHNLVAEINITPFTDVILVLLVIFMITTPLITQTSIKVKLPEAKSGKPIEDSRPDKAYLTITNEGTIYLDEKLVTRRELSQKIVFMYKRNPDLGVVLYADRLVRFKDIVSVLDELNGMGIQNLIIAATPNQQ